MPVEVSEFDELPEWMRERLLRGDAEVRIAGRPGPAAEFLAAVEQAERAEEQASEEDDRRP